MHLNEMYLATKFENKYAKFEAGNNVLDVGSLDINGTLKTVFPISRYNYIGCDIKAGPNVDIVLDSPHNWQYIGYYDIVVCASVVEHVDDIYKFFENLRSVCKVGGIIWILAPAFAKFHEYPIDCWRVYPDAMRFLLEKVAKLKILDVFCLESSYNESHTDTIGIARRLK